MSTVTKLILATFVALLAAVSIAACGGGNSNDPVAEVGGTPIIRATLNHWMTTIAGGDFYESVGITVPKGLVSDPQNNAACRVRLKTIRPLLGETLLKSKCQEMYRAIKEQTLSYLITAAVSTGEAAEVGITVGEREVKEAFDRLKAESFPKEGELQQFLGKRDWSLSDQLLRVKQDVEDSKLLQKIEHMLGKAGGERAVDEYYKKAATRWLAKTSCHIGYIVNGCSQYKAPKTAPIPPAILIEQIIRSE